MTRIADLLAKGRTYSFEFFPPKTDAEQATLVKTLRDLEPLGPSFVSVTYRGGAESRQRTFDLVTGMLRTTTLVPMAHLICVAHTRLELAEILVAYRTAGVENLMALGGDPPVDPGEGEGELRHASELVELASAIGGFSVGVAAQPNCHPLSPDVGQRPRPSGGQAVARPTSPSPSSSSRPSDYTGLVADLADRGVDKPVLPGIMPVTSLKSVPRMAVMGAAVPRLDGRAARGGRPARRARRRPAGRRGHRHRALRATAGRRRSRPPLLYAQPVERHARDLRRPGPGTPE